MRTPQGPDQGVRPTRPHKVYTMTRCGVRAVLERLPEVFPIEALSRGAQRIEEKHVVHGHLFAWGARIKEHSADPNLNIYIHASEHLYTYVYIYTSSNMYHVYAKLAGRGLGKCIYIHLCGRIHICNSSIYTAHIYVCLYISGSHSASPESHVYI